MLHLDLEKKKPVYHLFQYEGKKYILDYRNLFYSELDDILCNLFNYYANNHDINLLNGADQQLAKAGKTISDLYDRGIFFCENIELSKNEYHEAFISLAPVHHCNLMCKYCFAKHGDNYTGDQRRFTKETLEQSLHYLYLSYFKDIEFFRIDFVSGGEPLLAFDVIQHLITICENMNKHYNKKTKFWLCTNGTISNEHYFRILNDNGFNIGISMDGAKEENDECRIFHNGTGSYEHAANTIRSIMQNPELSRNFKNLWGLVVITCRTKSLVDILKHHKDIGFSSVQMKVVRTNDPSLAITDKNITKLKKLYKELFDYFIENINNNDVSCLRMILNDNDYFGKIIRRILIRTIVSNRCQAGKNKVSLSANGDLYPCDSFVGYPDFVLGNAMKEEVYPKAICGTLCSDRSVCSDCWARFICGGDCFHNSFLKNGDILIPDPVYCEIEKYLIELAVILLCYMNNNNPDLYSRIKKYLNLELRTR